MTNINNRDLSWLNFNDRVMQEAQDKTVPLLQRLRFLGIFSNNQDEFVKVRMADVIRLSQMKGKKVPKLSGNYTAKDLLVLLNERVSESQQKFSQIYKEILNEMARHGIRVIDETQLNSEQKTFCENYFSTVVNPRLAPLLVHRNSKMPFLKDSNIYHAVKMTSEKSCRYAIIQIPVNEACPRFVELPSKAGCNDIIFVDDIIRLCLNEIFFMFDHTDISAHTFKITRDAQLTLDDVISKSLIEKMEKGIEDRQHGQPVRLVYDEEMPEDLLDILVFKLKLQKYDSVEAGGRYHLKRDLMKFPKVRRELEYADLPPLKHPDITEFSSVLDIIRQKDILLSYPYHTFDHFTDLLREAAIDPKVKNIYITLYRTAENSKVINALLNAATNGKNVVVLLELFARFDEELNIENSELLQKAGVKVIHGPDGLKVHSKLLLVERQEKASLKGYAYIGTGNFNESTARVYGDFGLLTAKQAIVDDTRITFDFLINTHKHFACKKLLVSPYFMRQYFEKLITNEIKIAKKGRPAHIYAKFNSLTDERMIQLLYKASRAGVDVRLIVRGAFSLQPQITGLSENIRAISIVDKYLEHARMVIFHNNGDEKMFILSADWMSRNLDRRVEVAAPILDKNIQQTLRDFFRIQWADNVKARDLTIFGENNYIERGKNKKFRAQTELYNYYKKTSLPASPRKEKQPPLPTSPRGKKRGDNEM